MPVHVDKSSVINICVDEFWHFGNGTSYGTVMVNLDNIIGLIEQLIDSRETKKVEEWLKSYPNLKVISRDGAQTYSSAASNAILMQYRSVTDFICLKIYRMQLKNTCTACSRQG